MNQNHSVNLRFLTIILSAFLLAITFIIQNISKEEGEPSVAQHFNLEKKVSHKDSTTDLLQSMGEHTDNSPVGEMAPFLEISQMSLLNNFYDALAINDSSTITQLWNHITRCSWCLRGCTKTLITQADR